MIAKIKDSIKNLSFTVNEKKLILFITVVILAAGGIKLFEGYIHTSKPYDYSRSDSIFKVLSTRNDFAASDTIRNDSSAYQKKLFSEAVSDSMNSKGKNISKGSKQEFLKSTLININTVPKSDLIKLPGVGEATADKIIEYRSSKPFKKAADIMRVKGIGEKKFDKMKEFIKTEN